jgi:membrane protein implicated in regulation of membrane protease activity
VRPRQDTEIRLNSQSEAPIVYLEPTSLAWWRYVIVATLLGCLIILAAISFALAWVDEVTIVGLLSLHAAVFFSVLAIYAAIATRRRWRRLQKALLSARLRERRQFRKQQTTSYNGLP